MGVDLHSGRLHRWLLQFVSLGNQSIPYAAANATLCRPAAALTRLIHGGTLMLVLTRKIGQSITLGDPAAEEVIEIKVTEIKGDQVRLGITAPADTPVHRKEIWEEIRAQGLIRPSIRP